MNVRRKKKNDSEAYDIRHFYVPSKMEFEDGIQQLEWKNYFTPFIYKLASQCSIKRCVLIILLLVFLTLLPTVFYLMTTRIGNHDREHFYSAIDLSENGSHATTIPKIVHQIWIGPRKIPPHFLKCALTWKKLNSRGYEYRMWNMTSLTAFLRTRHSYYLSTWLNLRYTMNRVDTAKYFLMYTFGGLYVDLDVCNTQEDPIALLQSEKYLGSLPGQGILVQEGLPSGYNPEILMTTPFHPFFRHCLRLLYDSDRMYVIPYGYMMCVGGPVFLTRAVSTYVLKKEQIYVLPYALSRHKIFSSVVGGEWYTWDSQIIINGIYVGIFHGKMVPYWLSISIVLLITAFVVYKVYRVLTSDRRTQR